MASTIRPFEAADRAEILRIYAETFGEAPAARLAERWDWLFRDNPACALAPPLQWVAELDGRVAAYTGAYPVRFKLGGSEAVLQMEVDFVSDAAARTADPTMALRLSRAAVEAEGNLLANAIDSTPPDQLIRRRLKHRPVELNTSCFRLYRTRRALENRAADGLIPALLGRPPVAALASGLADLGLAGLNALRRPRRDPRFRIERLLEADERLDRMWARLAPKFAIAPVTDRAFVQWRYFDDPSFENAVFALIDAEDEIAGYTVARAGTHEQIDIERGRIMDLFCDPGDKGAIRTLVRAALDHLERFRPSVIGWRGPHPALRAAIKESLYVSRRAGEEPALLLWNGDPALAEMIYDARSWHIFTALTEPGFHP